MCDRASITLSVIERSRDLIAFNQIRNPVVVCSLSTSAHNPCFGAMSSHYLIESTGLDLSLMSHVIATTRRNYQS
jgi:hypothetical protein